jgi:molybdopterin-guanine dinucleotide biosynthesis protein A
MQAGWKQTTKTRLCHDEPVPSSNVAAAIVAGGQARRFGGQDKSRLLIDGVPIIVRQLQVLERIASSISIIANDADRFADLGVPVHADAVPDAGALGGLYTALTTAGAPRVVVVGCDQPHLDAGLLARLADLAAGEGADGAWVRTARGVEPFLACYRTASAARLRAALDAGHRRAGDLDHLLAMAVVDEIELARYGAPERLLANVNSPDDYARVQ